MWMFVRDGVLKLHPDEVMRGGDWTGEAAIDILIAVFREALSKELLGHMLRHHHAWPEPWRRMTFNILSGSACNDCNDTLELHSAYARMVTHFCTEGPCDKTPFLELKFSQCWIIVGKTERARHRDDSEKVLDLENEVERQDGWRHDLDQIETASQKLARALAEDLDVAAN